MDIALIDKPQKLLENYETWWWHHGAYMEQNGWIRPQPGAAFTKYDPWQSRSSAETATYVDHALDDLLALVRVKSQPIAELDAVLKWSANYGPLGVLPHRTLWVRLPSRPLTPRDLEKLDTVSRLQGVEPNVVRDRLAGTKVTTFRFQGGWLKSDELPFAASVAPSAQALLRARSARDYRFPEPESIGQAWRSFFPDVPLQEQEHFPYPEPESTDFAEAYCEPLDEWRYWVGMLATAIHELDHVDNAMRWTDGSTVLSWLVQPIAPVLRLDRSTKQPAFAWRAPSLIASLAMTAMQRMAASQKPRVCKDPSCGRVFIPSNDRAEYHSSGCRWRHNKELTRAASKPKRRASRPRSSRKQAKT